MKEHDVKLTLQETERLCRLYMDCRLTVFEETELQYVLGKLPYSSPCIDGVRMLMNVSIPMKVKESPKKIFKWFSPKSVIGIAASITILFAVGGVLLINDSGSPASKNDAQVYIAAYDHGKRLSGNDAVAATDKAMAKADAFMEYAALTERKHMMRADDIIDATVNK